MYVLLTGATGFLGQYLTRDLLLRGRDVAVLVRPSRRSTAAERVESMISYWEDQWKRKLPRPIVLSGDITQEGLGLSGNHRDWLRGNCKAILHSAASLTFYEKANEPWLSNVEGVRQVLKVCQQLDIRRLYHVSTAYTCGLREGTVYERELDVGQELGNDYERSKLEAELLVREANFLDVATIFRPSIIVGDSLTGFSSTFHGFYTPLRLACALQAQMSHEQIFDLDPMSQMGLSGDEGKNFVPVNWVSQAIVEIIERAPDRSDTYALVSQSPLTSARLFDVIRTVAGNYEPRIERPTSANTSSLVPATSDSIVSAYMESLHTYRSYWRDDPVFDCTNTNRVLPDLPCPVLTDDILIRLADWAVKAKFSLPASRPKPHAGRRLLQAGQVGELSQLKEAQSNARVLTITGHRGGSWTLYVGAAGMQNIFEGRVEGLPELCISSEAFKRVVTDETTLEAAARAGDVVIVGDTRDFSSWQQLFESSVRQVADI